MNWASVVLGSGMLPLVLLATMSVPLRRTWKKWQPWLIMGWLACVGGSWASGFDFAGWGAIALAVLGVYTPLRAWQWSKNSGRFTPKS